MNLRERLEQRAERLNIPTCAVCGVRHTGGAWAPQVGWHDAEQALVESCIVCGVGPVWTRPGEIPYCVGCYHGRRAERLQAILCSLTGQASKGSV